jgi:pyruvate dehydrogenase E2 component (dihydrolipoamide acetyltransferase)
MATPVIMPKFGQSVETCILTKWYKKAGEEIKKGEIIFAYETDKASFEEESKEDGILLATFFEEGDEVPVLTNVAVIGKAGESADEFRPGKSNENKKIEEKTEPETKITEVSEVIIEKTPQGEIKISPRAKALAEKLRVPYKNIVGSGPEGRIIERDIEMAAKNFSSATPLAYEIAENSGLYIPKSGTGIGNRILSSDLQTLQANGNNDFEIKKISNIRKIIADAMLKSMQNSAQLTHHIGADARRILSLRRQIKEKVQKQAFTDISINDIICYSVIKSLKQHPDVNSHFMGDYVKEFNKVHLGIAVDTPRGLMVPTVRNADDLTLQELSVSIKTLAEKCKQGSVDPDLLASTSASFTVTNLGAFGIEMFTPVLNIPQVGILGVNTIMYRPADTGEGVIGFVPYIGLSLTYNHQAIDGAPASRFLQTLKKEIENFNLDL